MILRIFQDSYKKELWDSPGKKAKNSKEKKNPPNWIKSHHV